MSYRLMTNWTEYEEALKEVLLNLSSSLSIFDEDFSRLKLDNEETASVLQSFLAANPANQFRIVIKKTEFFQSKCPRLMRLLLSFPGNMSVIKAPPHLANLNDAMLIVDNCHAVIRFHKDHARSKILLDDLEACRPYVQRFNDILKEGGEVFSPTPLGL